MHMANRRMLIIFGGLLVAVALVAGGFGLAHILKPRPNPIPAEISNKLEFSPLVIPANIKSPTTANYSTSVAEDGTRLLIYTIGLEGKNVTVSEYPQPSQFADVPDFKREFLDGVIQQTSSVSTSGGTIILGQMAKQKNKQFAVMFERGLIVFLTPSEPLEEKQWRTIGDALELIKLSN